MKYQLRINRQHTAALARGLAAFAIAVSSLQCTTDNSTETTAAGLTVAFDPANFEAPPGCVIQEYEQSFNAEDYPATTEFTLDAPADLVPDSPTLNAWLLSARWDDCGSLSVDGEVVVPDECDQQIPGDGIGQRFEAAEAGAPILLGDQRRQITASLTDLFPVQNGLTASVVWCDPEAENFLRPPNDQNCVLRAENQSFESEAENLPETTGFTIEAPADFVPEEANLDIYALYARWDDCGTLGSIEDECDVQVNGDGEVQTFGAPDNAEPVLVSNEGRSVAGTLTNLFPTQADFTGLVWWCEPTDDDAPVDGPGDDPIVGEEAITFGGGADHRPNNATLAFLRIWITNLSIPNAEPLLVYSAENGVTSPGFREGGGLTFPNSGGLLAPNVCNVLRMTVEASHSGQGWTRSYTTAGNNAVEPLTFRWRALPLASQADDRVYRFQASWADGLPGNPNTVDEQLGFSWVGSFFYPEGFNPRDYPIMWENVVGAGPDGCVDLNDPVAWGREYQNIFPPNPPIAP